MTNKKGPVEISMRAFFFGGDMVNGENVNWRTLAPHHHSLFHHFTISLPHHFTVQQLLTSRTQTYRHIMYIRRR